MKVQKTELAEKLNKLKGIVPKKTNMPALQGILVKDGCLIASNTEMTVKVKLEGAGNEYFIIPERAFGLISNLPDDEVYISVTAKNTITIQADQIKNKYQTMDPELFPLGAAWEEGSECKIQADVLLKAMKRVSYAVSAQGGNAIMSSVCLQAAGGQLNFVGLDGHVLAWDQVDYEGEFELLVPKNTVERLRSLGITGEVQMKYNRAGAVFVTEGFEIYTRLVDGEYFKYRSMFKKLPLHTVVSRTALLDAMIRAGMCTEEKCAVRFDLEGSALSLSIKDKLVDYHETIELKEPLAETLTIKFDVRLVSETLKTFDCDKVKISFGGPRMPMIVEAWDSEYKALVLPVAIR